MLDQSALHRTQSMGFDGFHTSEHNMVSCCVQKYALLCIGGNLLHFRSQDRAGEEVLDAESSRGGAKNKDGRVDARA